MSAVEIEPKLSNQVNQFIEDIGTYHAALCAQTGEENPRIIVEDLFAWTDSQFHSELRAAIFGITEGDWNVTQRITESGEIQFELFRTKNKIHYNN